jgi:hypothetical protein
VRALVSDADVVGVVADHLDRLHDAALRLGCSLDEAYAACEDAASTLLDDLEHQPEAVGDLVGGLFARGRVAAARARQAGTGAGPPETGDAEAQALHAALADLPERRRLGVLLLDSYAVTHAQTALALGLDVSETARTVALGRTALVGAIDGSEAISLAGHDVAIGDLGQLADGSAPAGGRFAGLRQHVSGCAVCAQTLGGQARAIGMLHALPVLMLDDAARGELMERVSARAATALPSVSEVEGELAGGQPTAPLIPAAVWITALVLAVLLGVGVGVLLHTG